MGKLSCEVSPKSLRFPVAASLLITITYSPEIKKDFQGSEALYVHYILQVLPTCYNPA